MQTVQAPGADEHPFPLDATQILMLGRMTMALTAAGCVIAAVIAYPLANHFSIAGQIAAHLALPVLAAGFKLGYVARHAAHRHLGNLNAG